MFNFKKFNFILADGEDNRFKYFNKEITYEKIPDGEIWFYPRVKICDIETHITENVSREKLDGLVDSTGAILGKSNISVVDRISLPRFGSSIAEEKENFTIVSSNKAVVMLNDFFLDKKGETFVRQNKLRMDANYKGEMLANNPVYVGQNDDKTSEDYQTHMALLKILRDIMHGGAVEKKEDYYCFLICLNYLRQLRFKLEDKDIDRDRVLALDIVKRYSK